MLAYGVLVGTHREFRLGLTEWLRYRRLLRAITEDARKRSPLTRQKRAQLRGEARRAARGLR